MSSSHATSPAPTSGATPATKSGIGVNVGHGFVKVVGAPFDPALSAALHQILGIHVPPRSGPGDHQGDDRRQVGRAPE